MPVRILSPKKVIISYLLVFFLLSIPFKPKSCDMNVEGVLSRSNGIGLTIDLNSTTTHKHHDLYLEMVQGPLERYDLAVCQDIDGDGFQDLVLNVINYSNDHGVDRRYGYGIIKGPIKDNRTYSSDDIDTMLFPYNSSRPYLVDIGRNKLPDVIFIEKGGIGKNDTVRVFLFNENGNHFWPTESFSMEVSNAQNGTVTSVQAIDIDSDGSKDLVVHKEISYEYESPPTVNHTKVKRTALILDGDKLVTGAHNESIIDTRLITDWVVGAGNDSYTGSFKTFFIGNTYRVLGMDSNYHPLEGGDGIGRVFLIGDIDLTQKEIYLNGNITSDLLINIPSGGLDNVQPVKFSNENTDDIIVQYSTQYTVVSGIFQGGSFNGPIGFIDKSDFKIWTENNNNDQVFLSFLDFNDDGNRDILCSNPLNTISDRTNCGGIRIGLNATDLEGSFSTNDIQDINVIGPETLSRIGQKLFITDLNSNGHPEILLPCDTDPNLYKIFIVERKKIEGPKVDRVVTMSDMVFRGDVLELEIFGSDPQNMFKYIDYELMVKVSDSEWFTPSVKKVVMNFSYDRPYDGSKTYHIDIPKNSTIGKVDLKVRATNTFGISSVWYEFDSIASVLNHPPSVQYPWLDKTVLRRTDRLNVSGTVQDLDDDGPFMLSVLVNDTVQNRKVHEGTTLKDKDFQISLLLNESYRIGPNYLVLEVIDPSGAIGRSVPLRFDIEPEPLSMTIPDPGQVLRGNDIVIRPVFTTEMDNVTLTIRSDPLDVEEFVLNSPGEEVMMTVPLHSGLGVFTAEYMAYDGYWNDSGSFQFEILNNIPFITLPDEVHINGTGSLSLISMLGDKEDGRNVSVSLTVLENGTGSSAVYDENERKLILEVFRDGIYDLKVTVTDRDGGSANDTLRIIGKKALEPTGPVLKVTVMDEKNDPIQGATVNILKDGSILSSLMTDINGSVSIELPEKGVYLLRVSPPNDRTWISGSRSGLMNKEFTVTIPPYEVELILEWKNASQSGKCSLVVVVINGEGTTVLGAGVTIDGPDNYHDSTNATGQVLFLDIEPGTYSITASYGKMTGSKSITLEPDSERTIEVVITTEKKSDNDIPWYYFLVLFLVILFIGLSLIFMMSRNRRRNEEE